MRKQHTSHPVSLRFRRWSRKAYAAFISVQRAVTMGCLSCHVVERLQNKNCSAAVTSISAAATEKNNPFDNSDDEELQVLPAGLQTTILFTLQPDAAPQPASIYYNDIPKAESNQCVTDAFRFFYL